MKYERGSFITVPSKETLRGLHPTAQALYMWLCAYANETGNCFPSRKTLAYDLNCSESMIDNMLGLLIEEGLLKKKGRKAGNEQLSNLYTVLIVPPLPLSGTPPTTEYATPSHDVRTNSIHGTQSIVIVADATSEKKVTPAMKEVFGLFTNPARVQWGGRVHQRNAAQALYDSYGLDELRVRYKVSQQYRDDQLCPQIDNPSDFLEKMPKMEKFLKDLQRV